MPPYAGEQQDQTTTMVVTTREEMHNAYYADIASPKAQPAAQQENDAATANDDESEVSSPAGKLDFLYDFNPCQSMSSAVFKVRNCSHCGQTCSKLRGYNKEIVETADGEIEKIYFHKWCSQLKDWKAIHAIQYKVVMDSMMANFLAAERAVAEERRIAQEKAEEAIRMIQSISMESEESFGVDSDSSASRGVGADADVANGKQSRGIGHALKAFMASMGCKGNQNKAVDEEATKELPQGVW